MWSKLSGVVLTLCAGAGAGIMVSDDVYSADVDHCDSTNTSLCVDGHMVLTDADPDDEEIVGDVDTLRMYERYMSMALNDTMTSSCDGWDLYEYEYPDGTSFTINATVIMNATETEECYEALDVFDNSTRRALVGAGMGGRLMCIRKCVEDALEALEDAFIRLVRDLKRCDVRFPFRPMRRRECKSDAADRFMRDLRRINRDKRDCKDDCDRVIKGDPHVHTAQGRIVDIYLPVGAWTPLVQGKHFGLLGKVFSKPDNKTVQWFDGLALVDQTTQAVVFEVTLPHDVELGKVGQHVNYVQLLLDGVKIDDTNTTYTSGLLEVHAAKLDSAVRTGVNPIFNDIVVVDAPDFSIAVEVVRETKRSNYATLAEQLSYTHLDFTFIKVPDSTALTGGLADVIWGTAQSQDAKRLTTPENAFNTA